MKVNSHSRAQLQSCRVSASAWSVRCLCGVLGRVTRWLLFGSGRFCLHEQVNASIKGTQRNMLRSVFYPLKNRVPHSQSMLTLDHSTLSEAEASPLFVLNLNSRAWEINFFHEICFILFYARNQTLVACRCDLNNDHFSSVFLVVTILSFFFSR